MGRSEEILGWLLCTLVPVLSPKQQKLGRFSIFFALRDTHHALVPKSGSVDVALCAI